MSDFDKILRAIIMQTRMTKSYDTLVTALEAIAGEDNVAAVDKTIERNKKKESE